jgi:hypothetical protein
MGKLSVVAALDLRGQSWEVGSPLPDKDKDGSALFPTTKIEKMILVGNFTEVFGRWTDKAQSYFRLTLMPPTVSIVMSKALRADWEAMLSDLEGNATKIHEAHDISMAVWKVGQPFPGDTTNTIAAMFLVGDMVEVFILPNPGTEVETLGLAMHVRLMPLTVQRTCSMELSFAECNQAARAAQVASDREELGLDPYEDEEEEEDDEEFEEEEEVVAAPPPRRGLSASTVASGIGSSTITAPTAVAPAAAPPAPAPLPNGQGSPET